MRVTSREHLNSRSEFVRRSGWTVLSTASLLALAACGGGGGGGGSDAPTPPPTPPNTAPTVAAGTDQTIELPTATAQLTGSATDSATSTLTYSWSTTSGPPGAVFGTPTAAATSVTFPAAGTYQFTLSASDGSLSGTDVVVVTVNPAVYPASDTANSDATNHGWTVVAAADVGMTQAQLVAAETYARADGRDGGAGMIVRRGRLVHSWGNIDRLFDVKSTTKSMGGIALGLAMANPTNPLTLGETVQPRLSTIGIPTGNHPEWLPQITVLQLATHTAGFRKPGGYVDMDFAPGTTWSYSDAALNWLAELLTTYYNEDLATVLGTRVWSVLGLNSGFGGDEIFDAQAGSDIHWRDNQARLDPIAAIQKRELAAGIYANVNAMARVGLLFLRKGVWANDQRVLSEEFVTTVSTPPASIAAATINDPTNFPGATTNYGVLWWTNATGMLANVPRDAFWGWGLGDSLIIVIPSLDIVAVRAGQQPVGSSPQGRVWNDEVWNGDYAVLAPFINPIVQSVTP